MMKKFVVLLMVLALVTPVLALDTNNTPAITTLQNVAGGTVSMSTGSWVATAPIAPGKTASDAPFGGTIISNSPATTWYKSEMVLSNHGATFNVDQSIGTGATVTYTSADGLQSKATVDGLGKFSPKNGTAVVSANIWADKMQAGASARTSSSGGFAAKTVLSIVSGGSVHITGTEASGTAGGNMILAYGANIDADAKVAGTGIFSGITRDGLGAVTGGRTLEFGRSGSSYVADNMNFEINGSAATVEAWSMKMNGCTAATAGTTVLRYVTDTAGVSSIDLYGNGAALLFGKNSKLDFVLGAAPTASQVYTLIDLIDGTATQNTTAGRLQRMDGTVLTESMNVFAKFGEQWYTFAVSYKGGTGNDVTLTYVVPEPATLGLLSLGGLLLARRRRA